MRKRRMPALARDAFRLVWQASPRLVVLLGALSALTGVAAAGSLVIVRHVVEVIVAGRGQDTGVSPVVGDLALLAILLSAALISTSIQRGVSLLLTEEVDWYANARVLDVTGSVELEAFDRAEFHAALSRAQNACSRPLQLIRSLVAMVTAAAVTAGLVVALAVVALPLLPVVLVAIAAPLIASGAFSRDFYAATADLNANEMQRQYLERLLVSREAAPELRAFGITGHLRERHRALFDARIGRLRAITRRSVIRSAVATVITVGATTLTLGALLGLVLSGRVSVPSASVGAVAFVQLGLVVTSVGTVVGEIYESLLFLEDHRTFCAGTPVASRSPSALAARPRRPGRPLGVVAEDVSFTYPGASRPALDRVSVTIAPGETVALVGENGSGKTTLAKVLTGLYRAHGGHVRWDGADVADLDRDRLADAVAIVFQDFGRFAFTAHDNVALGRIDRRHDRARVMTAAASVGADAFLERLPAGYDTVLASEFGGVDLSLGQWQRVALARAFHRDAAFVVMDEPTASLDPRAEFELYDRIRDVFADRSVLLVSHRFASVRLADRIYVLDGGRLIEAGTHDELMDRDGRYAELFELQASRYATDPR